MTERLYLADPGLLTSTFAQGSGAATAEVRAVLAKAAEEHR